MLNAEALDIEEDLDLVDQLLFENWGQKDGDYPGHTLFIDFATVWIRAALVHDVFKEKSGEVLW